MQRCPSLIAFALARLEPLITELDCLTPPPARHHRQVAVSEVLRQHKERAGVEAAVHGGRQRRPDAEARPHQLDAPVRVCQIRAESRCAQGARRRCPASRVYLEGNCKVLVETWNPRAFFAACERTGKSWPFEHVSRIPTAFFSRAGIPCVTTTIISKRSCLAAARVAETDVHEMPVLGGWLRQVRPISTERGLQKACFQVKNRCAPPRRDAPWSEETRLSAAFLPKPTTRDGLTRADWRAARTGHGFQN